MSEVLHNPQYKKRPHTSGLSEEAALCINMGTNIVYYTLYGVVTDYCFFFRWREESKVLAETSEKTIANLSNELIRCRMRIDELTKQLSHLKSVKEDLVKRLKNATESKENLQARLQEAEGQAEGARTQVAEMVTQAKGLLEERRELNRQLDQVKLQMTRTTRFVRMNANCDHYASNVPILLCESAIVVIKGTTTTQHQQSTLKPHPHLHPVCHDPIATTSPTSPPCFSLPLLLPMAEPLLMTPPSGTKTSPSSSTP